MKRKLSVLAVTLCLCLSALVPASALELEDARQILRNYYVDQIPEEVLALDSLEEILAALNDPYTVYMSPEEYSQFRYSLNGEEVVGIGVSIRTVFEDGYRIYTVLPDSPALEAGLEEGDRIVAVDGVTLTPEMNIRGMIDGEEGTPVRVAVVRGDGTVREFEMERRRVVIPIVGYQQEGTAGYINCTSFGDSTDLTMRKALKELDADTAVWVVDLRKNPGGTSLAACNTAALFTGAGTTVLYSDARGLVTEGYTDSEDLTDKPLIVLTGSATASGSELFAGVIRDYDAGIAVGQRTFGKGIAQYVFESGNTRGLFDGDCLKVTAYRFYSPEGATNHVVGVLPTLLVSPENTLTVAMLLSGAPHPYTKDRLKVELAGQEFTIDTTEALREGKRTAFTELLEALPPSAALYEGVGYGWKEITPAELAEKLSLTDFQERTFTDIGGCEFQREIRTLAAYGLLSGYGDGSFQPDAPITRAEFCAMLAGALNLRAGSAAPAFTDVGEEDWFSGCVTSMAARGFISGYGDGSFRPDSPISYEQMVTILGNVAAWSSTQAREYYAQGVPIREYLDYAQFSEWAMTSARTLDRMDCLVGDRLPDRPGTRQVAAGLLCNMMEQIGLLWD